MISIVGIRKVEARISDDPDPDVRFFAKALAEWLDAGGRRSMEASLGIEGKPGKRSVFSEDRRERRDKAICELANHHLEERGSDAAVAKEIHSILKRYEPTYRRDDSSRLSCPDRYLGARREHEFMILNFNGDEVPGEGTIRKILGTRRRADREIGLFAIRTTCVSNSGMARIGTADMSADRSSTGVSAAYLFEKSDLGKKLIAENHEQTVLRRKALLDERGRLNEDAGVENRAHSARQKEAIKRLRVAEQAVLDHKREMGRAELEHMSKAYKLDTRRNEIERELSNGAAPEIDEFMEFARDELQHNNEKFRYIRNYDAITRYKQAIQDELGYVLDLKLLADQGEVPGRLADIRARLAEIERSIAG